MTTMTVVDGRGASLRKLQREGLFVLCAVIVTAFSGTFDPVFGRTDSAPSFEKDIKPIFEKHCLSCHSSQVHSSGLVLESLESILQGGALHGPALIVGKGGASPII